MTDIPRPAPGDTDWIDWADDEEATSDAFRDGVSVAELSATGTPSSTTFLRGDGTWASPSTSAVPDATTTTKGVVELATTAETTTGTDSTRAVTPAGVKAVADTKVTGSIVTRAQYNAGPKTAGVLYILTD